MTKPSRLFSKSHREFRAYIRLSHNLVQKRTDIKNQAQAILSLEMFRLNDVLTDIFGKNGRMILSGICSGQKFNQIVDKLSLGVHKKSEQIKEVLEREISQSAAVRLRTCLNLIQDIDEQISNLETRMFSYAYKHHKHEMHILMSCPGIGEISAATLIAEIGDFKDFSSRDKLASWLGIVSKVYQSADKYHNGRITKRSFKIARWVLTQVANAASRKKASKLKEFFNRKKKTIGYQKAIIALARKIVTIIWHLITKNEMYEDETGYQKGENRKRKIVVTAEISIDERISIISEIFAIVNKKELDVT